MIELVIGSSHGLNVNIAIIHHQGAWHPKRKTATPRNLLGH